MRPGSDNTSIPLVPIRSENSLPPLHSAARASATTGQTSGYQRPGLESLADIDFATRPASIPDIKKSRSSEISYSSQAMQNSVAATGQSTNAAEHSDVRHIPISVGAEAPHSHFCGNEISTGKYNLFTFLPLNLFEQFRRFANLYYLFVSILSSIRELWPSPVGNVLPLVFVLTVSAVKEAIEDYRRHVSDRRINLSTTEICRNGTWQTVQWKDVKVGDIIRVDNRQPLPADVLVLTSSEEFGRCYIETSNLDGETNLKGRQALPETAITTQLEQATQWVKAQANCTLSAEAPNLDLYHFEGTLNMQDPRDKSKQLNLSLGSTQMLLRGSVLRNTAWIMGVVAYTGNDTKVMLNSSDAPLKFSNMDRLMNKQLYAIFGLLVAACFMSGIGDAVWTSNEQHQEFWYLDGIFSDPGFTGVKTFATSLIAFSFFIPISLYVSIEIVKTCQMFFINWDINMYHEETDTPANVKTSNLNEELGQIKYVFSDKTGTLTCNKMEFVRCSVAGQMFGSAPGTSDPEHESTRLPFAEGDESFKDSRLWTLQDDRQVGGQICEFLRLMALCHTVVPEREESSPENIIYNAASPDEGALVQAAKLLGFRFEDQNPKVKEINVKGVSERYSILNVLEFNSTRKRMSTILRRPDGSIVLYCKGADNIMFERLADKKSLATLKSHVTEFSQEGLRTLVLAKKELEEQEWATWNKSFEEASTSMVDREEKLDRAAELIETDLQLVGATAIEDKLQDGVPEAIKQLKKATVKVWMLTGDKLETAINIGHSCMLLNNDMRVFEIGEDNASSLSELLSEAMQVTSAVSSTGVSCGIVVEGRRLGECLTPEHRAQFLQVADACDAVICCRVSPKQKAQVVGLVKENVSSLTLAIGDGANDVAMIQEAHVGIGISGLEGMQAVLASDYAIAQFRFLEPLLLQHGRYAYRRMARMINYSFHKNMVFVLPQVFYVIVAAFSGQPLYDTQSGSLFNVLFAFLPIAILAIFETDLPAKKCVEEPKLYLPGQVYQSFNIKRFVWWTVSAIFQSIVIFALLVEMFRMPVQSNGDVIGLASMGVFGYSVAVITINFKVAIMAHSWNWIMHLAVWISIAGWFLFSYVAQSLYYFFPFLEGTFDIVSASSNYWLFLLLVPFTVLIPDWVCKFAKRWYSPELFHLIQEESKLEKKKNNPFASRA